MLGQTIVTIKLWKYQWTFTRVNIPNQNSTSMTGWPMSRSCQSRSCCLLDVLEIVIDSVMDPTFHVTASHTSDIQEEINKQKEATAIQSLTKCSEETWICISWCHQRNQECNTRANHNHFSWSELEISSGIIACWTLHKNLMHLCQKKLFFWSHWKMLTNILGPKGHRNTWRRIDQRQEGIKTKGGVSNQMICALFLCGKVWHIAPQHSSVDQNTWKTETNKTWKNWTAFTGLHQPPSHGSSFPPFANQSLLQWLLGSHLPAEHTGMLRISLRKLVGS